jgi:probable HAF family extracellular repeat protein
MALGINNEGQIVGAFVDSTGEHGFLDTDGSFTTIDPPGSLLFEVEANGINDVGEIVGFNNGTGRSFLATPLSEIPEPSSLAVLASS